MVNTAKLKIKRGTPIYVVWMDAVGHSNGWVTEEEAEEASKEESWEVKQLGFMFDYTEEYISMCASINEGETNNYSQFIKIPSAWIKEIYTIKL